MIYLTKLEPSPHINILIEGESIPGFIQLLNRALNTWDDAPPELKALADTIIYGQQLQDYNNLPR